MKKKLTVKIFFPVFFTKHYDSKTERIIDPQGSKLQ